MPLFRQTYTLEDAEHVIKKLYELGFKPGRQSRHGEPFFYAEPRTAKDSTRIMRITASSSDELYAKLTETYPSKVGA